MKDERCGNEERWIDKPVEMEIKTKGKEGREKLSERFVNVNPFPLSTMSKCLRAKPMNVFVKKFVHFYDLSGTVMGHFRSFTLLQNKITAFQYITLRKWNDG